jgi:phosphoserine phosphatase RsbU/P
MSLPPTGGEGLAPAAFIVRSPSGARDFKPIERLPFRIGRHGDNELVLRDSRTSRHHAEVVSEGGGYVVRDLGSSHGVFVNGTRVESARLRPSDRVEFGFPDSYQLTFALADAGAVAAAAAPTPEEKPPAGSGTVAPGLAKLRATLEVVRALESSLSTDEVLAAVVDAALTITGCERGFLLLRKGDDCEIRIARSRGGPLPTTDLHVPRHLLLRALAQRKDFLSMNFDPLGEPGDRSIHDLELRSVVCVPLVRVHTAGAVETVQMSKIEDTAGLLYMDSRARDADLSSGGRELLTTLALEASTILENARLIEEQWARQRMENELRIARQIQESLLPRALPSSGWFRAAASSVPSLQVGGDYFDIRAIGETFWAVVEADVSGKGVGAALLASLLQGMFLASPFTRLTIEEMMTRVNRYLIERTAGEQYATAFYGTLDCGGCLRWVNAGHPPVLLVRGGGEVEILPANGTPLGMIEEARYSVAETVLKPGNKLVIYSDGVLDSESEAREPFGFGRLRHTVHQNASLNCRGLHAAILAAVDTFTESAPPPDDITLAVIEFQPE